MEAKNEATTNQPDNVTPINKLPYSPPLLVLLETEEIAGGPPSLQEADGDGFVGS